MANIDDRLLDILRWPNNKAPVRQSTAIQIKLEQIERINKLFHSLLISKLPEKKPTNSAFEERRLSTPESVQNSAYNSAIDDMHQVIDELFGVK